MPVTSSSLPPLPLNRRDLLIGAGTTQGLTAYEATASPAPTATPSEIFRS